MDPANREHELAALRAYAELSELEIAVAELFEELASRHAALGIREARDRCAERAASFRASAIARCRELERGLDRILDGGPL